MVAKYLKWMHYEGFVCIRCVYLYCARMRSKVMIIPSPLRVTLKLPLCLLTWWDLIVLIPHLLMDVVQILCMWVYLSVWWKVLWWQNIEFLGIYKSFLFCRFENGGNLEILLILLWSEKVHFVVRVSWSESAFERHGSYHHHLRWHESQSHITCMSQDIGKKKQMCAEWTKENFLIFANHIFPQ